MMKKLSLALVVVLAVVMCVFCLTACGGSVEGTYKFYSAETNGKTYKVGDTVEEADNMKLTKDYMVLELKADNKATYKVTLGDETETEELTWELSEDEKTVILKYEDEAIMEFKRDGNKLVMERGEGEYKSVITLKK